jgi:hypothetical protein
MNSRAVDADEDTVGDGGPCWVFSVAIEANLIGKWKKLGQLQLGFSLFTLLNGCARNRVNTASISLFGGQSITGCLLFHLNGEANLKESVEKCDEQIFW